MRRAPVRKSCQGLNGKSARTPGTTAADREGRRIGRQVTGVGSLPGSWSSNSPDALFLATANRQSTFRNHLYGGIAQLVERQLCKLEVRGSNPLASSLRSRRRVERRLSRRSFERRRTAFHLATPRQRATTRQANDEKWQILLHLHSAERARR